MKRQSIPFERFVIPVVESLNTRWMLLTAGVNTPGRFNAMTVSWGGLGVIWNKPLAIVFVRPSRFTFTFMEQHDSFTLSAFPGEYKDQLTLCGTRSGRSLDKIQATGLTPLASTAIAAPGYDEAELILECRKMYYDDIEPGHFLADHIEKNYGGRDYHRMYFGEIAAIHGTAAYVRG